MFAPFQYQFQLNSTGRTTEFWRLIQVRRCGGGADLEVYFAALATAWMPYRIGYISLGKRRTEKLLAYCMAYALNADVDLSEMWTIQAERFAYLLACRAVH